MNRLTLAAILAAIPLAACLPKSPAQICASPDVHGDVISVLIGNLDEYGMLFGDRLNAIIDRRAEFSEAIESEIRFSNIALEERDSDTGRITCSAEVSPATGEGDSYRLVFTRQKEAGGSEFLYTTRVFEDVGNGQQSSQSIPDIWFIKLLIDATERLDNPQAQRDPTAPTALLSKTQRLTSSSSTDQTIYERRGVRLVRNDEAADVYCFGCQGQSTRRPLRVGRVFFKQAWGDFVLLTQDTGNARPGGTTYSVNLQSLQIFDLQTNSGAAPQFVFDEQDGGVVVEITQDDRKRRLVLTPPRTSSHEATPPPAASTRDVPSPLDRNREEPAPESETSGDIQAITTPASWLHQPTAIMPQSAIDAGLRGWAELRCRVSTTGRLLDCGVMEENPAGSGLGRAAVLGSIASGRLRPAFAGDNPVTSTIQFRVHFRSE